MKENKKILIFSTAYFPFVGGAEVAVKEITNRLGDDFSFDLITAKMKKDLLKFERIGQVNVYRLGVGHPLFDKLFLAFFGWLKAKKLHKRNNYSFSWAIMASFGGLSALFFKKRCKVPLFLTLQEGDDLEYIKKKSSYIRKNFLEIFTQADFIQVISSFLKHWAVRNGAESEIRIIPNGVDFLKFKREDGFDREEFRKNLGFKNDDKLIITTSRLVKKNGVRDLLKSLSYLENEFKFLILGEGEEKDNLLKLTEELNLKNRVYFLGTINHQELPKYLWASDVFCRPSLSEGLGNSFLEAMTAGIPVVATEVGGIPDFLRHGENGLFCEVENSKDIADKIKQIFSDEDLKSRIIENGIKTVQEAYTWDLVASRMSKAFSDLGEKNKKRKINILIATGIFPPDIGGPATYSKLLLSELPKKNFGVSLLSFSHFRDKYPKIISHFFYFLNILKLGRSVEIIYVQDPVSVGLPVALANFFLRKKMILKIVGDYAWEQGCQRFDVKDFLDDFSLKYKDYFWPVKILKKIQLFSARRAKNIIVPSNYLKKIVSNWGVNPSKIKVIYNAFDGIDCDLEKEGARRDLNLDFEDKIVISAGRLVPWKGFAVLIKAFKDFNEKESKSKLLIAGEGGEKESLLTLIKNLNLEKSVILLGRLDRNLLMKYLKTSDLFVLNTSYEGFSHQLLEVMALGLPLLTTRVGGNVELVTNRENGLFFDFNDLDKITELMFEFFSDSVLRYKLSENSKKRIEDFTEYK
ncbi:MAG: glycosyltransferase family 4 protein, partial [Patescibacteria group bacterium]